MALPLQVPGQSPNNDGFDLTDQSARIEVFLRVSVELGASVVKMLRESSAEAQRSETRPLPQGHYDYYPALAGRSRITIINRDGAV